MRVYLFALLFVYHTAFAAATGIVLLIADGVSHEAVTATRIYKHGVEGKLALDKMPYSAFVRTYSASHLVTDSSAAATAMARGAKVNSHAVGITHEKTENILDIAKHAGWSTAVITTDSVTGGTPAPFLVETEKRSDEADIAAKTLDALGTRADFVMGGGAKWFRPPQPSAKHADILSRNAERVASGKFGYFETWEDFLKRSTPPALCVFYPDHFPMLGDGDYSPRLLDMVKKTVEIFRSQEKPFLIIAESSASDKIAHMNNAKYLFAEIVDFDETLAWLREHCEDCLILATSDHGTGGLIINGYQPAKTRGDALLEKNKTVGMSHITWATGPGKNDGKTQAAHVPMSAALHTGGDTWLFGAGPGAEIVRGTLENTDIHRIIQEAIFHWSDTKSLTK